MKSTLHNGIIFTYQECNQITMELNGSYSRPQ